MIEYPERMAESSRKFKEVIHESQLDTVIDSLMMKAYTKVSDVSLWGKGSKCQTVPVRGQSYSVYFLIINNTSENKREIIYELLHEMGHLFDEIELDPSVNPESEHPHSERSREIRAWKFADDEIEKHPELNNYKKEYDEHKRMRLASYDITL